MAAAPTHTPVPSRRAAAPEAWTGLVAAVVLLAAFALPAPPPAPGAPGAELAAFLDDRRSLLLASSGMIAAGGVLYLWFVCTLGAWLEAWQGPASPASGARLASVVAAAVGTAILVSGAALQSALVLQSADASEELVRFGFDAYNSLVTIAGACFGLAVIALAVAGGRSGALPRGLALAGWAVAPLQFLTLAGLAQTDGFFAAGGTMAIVAFWALAAWYGAVAIRVLRRPEG